MLTFIVLSAALIQEPPAPPGPPEAHARVMVINSDGPGALDKDGDGQVSREEFAAPMNDHFGRLDSNGDGRLSSEELAGGHGSSRSDNVMIWRGDKAGAGPGEHHFEMRRGDGEGHTMVFSGEPGERREHEIIIQRGSSEGHGGPHIIRRHGPGGPGGDVRFEFHTADGADGPGEMDKDGDDRISEAEFTAPLRDAFARMDADHSGFIEEGEHGGDGDVRVFTHRIETRQSDED